MEWLVFSLLVPLFAAFNNVVDQIMIRKYFPENGIVAMYMGGLVYLCALPLITIVFYSHIIVDLQTGLFLTLIGLLSPFIWIPYFKALEIDDAAVAMPVIQLFPIFLFILAFLFLGETVSPMVLLGAAIMIFASIGITYDPKIKSLKTRTFIYMLICAFFVAIQAFAFRIIAGDINVLTASYWIAIGFGIILCAMLFGRKKNRKDAYQAFQRSKGKVAIPVIAQECSYFTSIVLTVKALETAPSVGIFGSIQGFQNIYILLLSWVAGCFFKDVFESSTLNRVFLARLFWGCLMIAGLFLLYLKT